MFVVDASRRLYDDDSRLDWGASTTMQVADASAVLWFGKCGDNSRPVIVTTFLVENTSYSIHFVGDPADNALCSAVDQKRVRGDLLQVLTTLQIHS